MRRLLVLALALGGCSFRVTGLPLETPGDDLGVGDLGGGDGPELGPLDLSEDFAGGADLADVDFTTPPIDLAGADLTPPVPNFPSHVPYHYLADSAADWTVAQNTTLDTTSLSISSPFPAGTIITVEGAYTVLAVRRLSIGTAVQPDVRLRVVGARPLVIVAGEEIHVWGLIDAGGHANEAGPSGGRSGTGSGAGAAGGTDRAGGGGGGYGTVGGKGGANPLTAGGATYGNQALAMLEGGSGGGAGRPGGGNTRAGCTSPAAGGAGGGALQLTSRLIVVESAATNARGTISVAGGGGAGGCAASQAGAGGGGGGSGGALFLEAPMLMLNGRLTAAGGGGGGGGSVGGGTNPPSWLDGLAGLDGFVAQAPGLSSYGGLGAATGGGGYNGLTLPQPAGARDGGWSDGGTWGGGGGGGGAGRIRIRASVAQNPPSTTPPPSVVVELPPTIP